MKYYSLSDGGSYDYVFAGATFLSVGAATVLSKKGFRCLLLDRLMMPGHEFSYALSASDISAVSKKGLPEGLTPYAAELYAELQSRDAVADSGRYYNPALTPVLCLKMSRERLQYMPLTSVIDAEYKDGMWKLMLVSPGTRMKIKTKYIVDTTPDGRLSFLYGCSAVEGERTLNALMLPPQNYSGERNFAFGAHEMCETGFPGEFIARFRFSGDLITARTGLCDYVTSAPEALSGWRVLSVADEFDIRRTDEAKFIRRGLISAPSTSYPDAVAAYDAGAKLALSLYEGEPKEPEEKNYSAKPHVIDEPCNYDIIVAGLGTAGAISAISLARRGFKVLGIEQFGCMGGTGTAGAIASQYLGFKGGAYLEIDREAALLREHGFIDEKGAGCVSKALSLEMSALKSGVSVKFGATVIDVIRDKDDEKRILGVRWIDEKGIHEARAEYTIDATADGLVCLMSGCEMLGGRPSDGGFQLYSNVSRNYSRERDILYSTNQDDGTVNQYNPADLGCAVINSCTSPLHLPPCFTHGCLRKLGPAPLLGVREGMRIVGENTVTLPDITAGKHTDKPVFYEYANLDNHGKDTAFEERAFRDWIEICSLWDCRIAIPLPAGALIPKGYHGLLTVGRSISVDHSISFAVRMKDAMQKCAEAAAELIILAKKHDCDVRDVPYQALEKRLYECGVITLGDAPGANYYNPDKGNYNNNLRELAENPDKLYSLLSSDQGGAAVMAAAQNIKKYSELLRKWIKEDGPVKLNSALALCLSDCVNEDSDEAAKVIIDAIGRRSGRQPECSHTFNFPYAISAISAAGRIGLRGAVEPLLNIIINSDYTDGIPDRDTFNGKTKLISNRDDIKFLYFTSALSSLNEICMAHPEIKKDVADVLSGLNIERDGYVTSVSMIGHSDNIRRDLAPLINKMLNQINNI